MAEYTIYDIETGEILSNSVCQDEVFGSIQVTLGQGMYPGNYSRYSHHFIEGVPLAYSEAVASDKLSVPNHRAVWSNATCTWVDPRTLADLKLTKTAEINASRLNANRSSFTFAGKQIACDELSRSDIDGFNGIVSLTGALPPDWIGYWKAVDNTLLAIPDVATWTGLYAAMVAQGQANFAHSQDLKAVLAAATTAAEVEGIVW